MSGRVQFRDPAQPVDRPFLRVVDDPIRSGGAAWAMSEVLFEKKFQINIDRVFRHPIRVFRQQKQGAETIQQRIAFKSDADFFGAQPPQRGEDPIDRALFSRAAAISFLSTRSFPMIRRASDAAGARRGSPPAPVGISGGITHADLSAIRWLTIFT
jgi:hypothetical protein